jgi:hypothetical protein
MRELHVQWYEFKISGKSGAATAAISYRRPSAERARGGFRIDGRTPLGKAVPANVNGRWAEAIRGEAHC